MSRRWTSLAPARLPPTPRRGLTCRELVELVTDYLEGALPESERARFEAHIAGCDALHRIPRADAGRRSGSSGTIEPGALDPDVERELLAAFRDWKAEGT